MNEPKILFKGDIGKWTETPSGYPSSAWTMVYEFDGAGTIASITGVASGDGFEFTLATALATAGTYYYRGYVQNKDGSEIYTVSYGQLDIKSLSVDSTAKAILDKIDAAIEDFIDDGGVVSLSIQGRTQAFTSLADLQKARDYWKKIVVNEYKEIQIAQGKQTNTRFFLKY